MGQLPTQLLFEKDEWQAAYVLNKKKPPREVPALNTVVRLVAQLGGFLGRKGDGEPGVKTLWLGMACAISSCSCRGVCAAVTMICV